MQGGALRRPFTPRVARELTYRLIAGAVSDNEVSIADYVPSPTDQRGLNSCVAHAYIAGELTLRRLAGLPLPNYSHSWLWTRCRQRMGAFPANSGTYIADACDIALHRGIGPVELAPETDDPTIDPDLTEDSDDRALQYKFLGAHQPFYASDPGGLGAGIATALAAGKPVLLAMNWYAEFFNVDSNGKLPPYATGSLPVFGHCVLAHTKEPGWTKCRNSWGAQWGDHGDFWVPDQYLLDGTVWEARALSPAPIITS